MLFVARLVIHKLNRCCHQQANDRRTTWSSAVATALRLKLRAYSGMAISSAASHADGSELRRVPLVSSFITGWTDSLTRTPFRKASLQLNGSQFAPLDLLSHLLLPTMNKERAKRAVSATQKDLVYLSLPTRIITSAQRRSSRKLFSSITGRFPPTCVIRPWFSLLCATIILSLEPDNILRGLELLHNYRVSDNYDQKKHNLRHYSADIKRDRLPQGFEEI